MSKLRLFTAQDLDIKLTMSILCAFGGNMRRVRLSKVVALFDRHDHPPTGRFGDFYNYLDGPDTEEIEIDVSNSQESNTNGVDSGFLKSPVVGGGVTRGPALYVPFVLPLVHD